MKHQAFLWGKGITSIKIELCHCTPFAFAATGPVLGEDAPIPLTKHESHHRTKREVSIHTWRLIVKV